MYMYEYLFSFIQSKRGTNSNYTETPFFIHEVSKNSKTFFFWGGLSHECCWIFIPQPGIEPRPQQWKHRVLTTGPLGKSPRIQKLNTIGGGGKVVGNKALSCFDGGNATRYHPYGEEFDSV